MKSIKTVFLVIVLILGVLLFYILQNEREKSDNDKNKAEAASYSYERNGRIMKDGTETPPASEGPDRESEVNKEGAPSVTDTQSTAEAKKIALTFDDGPHPFYTEQLLDGLKERGVVATFFVTGEHASLHPEVIKRMQEEGHLIGNHTYSHIQLRTNNRQEFMEELQLTSSVIKEITGEDTIYVRPPYGSWDKGLEQEMNMIPVLWTVDPLDWCTDDVSRVVRRVKEKVEENSIILMHDYYASTVTAALKIVDILQEEGYEFVTVDEILFE